MELLLKTISLSNLHYDLDSVLAQKMTASPNGIALPLQCKLSTTVGLPGTDGDCNVEGVLELVVNSPSCPVTLSAKYIGNFVCSEYVEKSDARRTKELAIACGKLLFPYLRELFFDISRRSEIVPPINLDVDVSLYFKNIV